MRAVTYQAPGEVRVDEKPDPEITSPDEALIRVEATGICGSDLHLIHGRIKIEQGFTTDVVGWEGSWQTLGDFPVRPGDMFEPQGTGVAEDEPVKVVKPRGTVTRSTSRTPMRWWSRPP